MFFRFFESQLLTQALAQTAAPVAGTAAAQPSTVEMMLPFVVVFALMYVFLIRPQSKKQKEQQKFLSEIKRGDEVVTSSGILGKIEGLTETFVTLQIADGVSVRMLRSQIAGTSQSVKQAPSGTAKLENNKQGT